MPNRLSQDIIAKLESQGYTNIIAQVRGDTRPQFQLGNGPQFMVMYDHTVQLAGSTVAHASFKDIVRLQVWADYDPKTGDAKLAEVMENTLRHLYAYQNDKPRRLDIVDDRFVGAEMLLSDGGLNL